MRLTATPITTPISHPFASSLEQPYRYVYFNEMNLAVKSPLMYRQMTTLPPDMMRLLVEINLDYDW